MKANRTLETKWEKIARVFSKNVEVNVNVQTARCCTDGNTVFIPANADKFNESDQQVIEGMLDHEWGHIREESIAKEQNQTTPLQMVGRLDGRTGLFFNAIEDIRIEDSLAQDYVGVAENLRTMNKRLYGDLVKEFDPSRASPTFTIAMSCSFRNRGLRTDWLTPEYELIIDMLQPEIDMMDKCSGPQDVSRLAKRFIARLGELEDELNQQQEQMEAANQEQEGDQEQPGQGTPGDGGDSGDSDQESDGAGEDESEGGAGGGEGDGIEDDSPDSGNEGAGAGGKGKVGEDESEDDSKDNSGDSGPGSGDEDFISNPNSDSGNEQSQGDSVPQATKDACDLLDQVQRERNIQSDPMQGIKDELTNKSIEIAKRDREHIPDPKVLSRDEWNKRSTNSADSYLMESYVDLKKEAGKAIGALRAKLMTLLKIKSQSVVVGDQENGHIDPSVLYSTKTGNKRIFSHTVPGQELDVAISVLIDQSGSMNRDNRMRSAKLCVVAMSESFNQLSIPFEICGHHTWRTSMSSDYINRQMEVFNRFVSIHFWIHKAFGERYDNLAKARIAAATDDGCNVDSECVMHAAKRLAAQPQQRKILIVLSDGKPNVSLGDNNIQYKALKKVVTQIVNAGIEVYSLGIQTDHVKTYYPDWDVAYSVDEMPVKLFKMLRRYLVRAA